MICKRTGSKIPIINVYSVAYNPNSGETKYYNPSLDKLIVYSNILEKIKRSTYNELQLIKTGDVVYLNCKQKTHLLYAFRPLIVKDVGDGGVGFYGLNDFVVRLESLSIYKNWRGFCINRFENNV